ncbi:MAG: hypothetical protein ACR2HF_00260, partial [Methylococcaceae bacterium]
VFGGEKAAQDVPELHDSQKSTGVTFAVNPVTEGQGLSGPGFLFDPAQLGTQPSFDVEVTLNGVVYQSVGIASDADDQALVKAIEAASSEAGATLDQSGLTVTVAQATGEEGQGWVVRFGGDLAGQNIRSIRVNGSPADVPAALDETPGEEQPKGMAVGGVVVRNDVRGSARAYILRADVTAGALTIKANDDALIEAKVDSTAESTGGDGGNLAVGGVIATNLVLSTSEAYISGSTVKTTEGDVVVEGVNSAHIEARNKSSMTSDGTSVGVTLAFNTVGWQAQNVLYSTIDALVGTNLGTEQPARMKAYIQDSDIDAAGNVSVQANSEAYIHADLSNETSSTVAAAEGGVGAEAPPTPGVKPKGLSAGFVLSSNMVSSQAESWVKGANHHVTTEAGAFDVRSSDDANITSKVNLSAVAEAKESEASLALKGLINYVGITYTDRSGEQKLKIGDRVRVADADYDSNDRPELLTAGERVTLKDSIGGGVSGATYEYLGDDEEKPRLDQQDYADSSLWKRVRGQVGTTYMFVGDSGTANLANENFENTSRWFAMNVGALADVGYAIAGKIGAADVGASAFGGLVVRNDVRSDVKSSVEDQDLTIAGDINITATDSARISAQDDSTVSAKDKGINVVIATNTILGGSCAWMTNSKVKTTASDAGAGDVSVSATNTAVILAELASSVQASTSVGVTLAFNTIGYQPQNLLYNLLDGVLGIGLQGQQKAATEAWIKNTPLEIEGSLNVLADWDGSINAQIVNSALAVSLDTSKEGDANSSQSAITVAPVVAMNKIAADVSARIEQARAISAGGDIRVKSKSSTAINAEVSASAISIAAGAKGDAKSISVGFSLARNDIDSTVNAYISSTANQRPEITSSEGQIQIGVERTASITANGTASAVAIAASPKGGPAVAGGGTLAFNRISGNSDAYASNVVLTTEGTDEGTGNVLITANDSSTIDAYLRSVAAAVSVGGQSTKAFSLGLSVARNIIGSTPAQVSYDYRASQFGWDYKDTDGRKELEKGDLVRRESGQIYQYLGNSGVTLDLGTVNYTSRDWKSNGKPLTELTKGTKVLNDSSLLGQEVYEYVGDTAKDSGGIELTTQNYSDESSWKLLSYTPTVASTLARLVQTEVNATGALRLDATGTGSINATVLAGAAAVAASASQGATSVSAAGVYAENRIQAKVNALIDGVASGVTVTPGNRPSLSADSISILSEGRASIDAIAGAASLAASLGGGGSGLAVSIGLSLAFNSINNDVQATVNNAHLQTTTGSVDIHAINAGELVGPSLNWTDLTSRGITAKSLDAAANAGAPTSFTSSEGQEWDYLNTDGETELNNGDPVRAASGRIYTFTGEDGTTLDLGTVDYQGDNWDEVDTGEWTVKDGYTVLVDALHTYGGLPGRVYRYLGTKENYTTEDFTDKDEQRLVLNGDVVRVASNHEDGDLVGKVYKYIGDTATIKLPEADFGDSDNWEELQTEENVALWEENYADTSRWQLADDFADPETVGKLAEAMNAAGFNLPQADRIRPVAKFSSSEGLYWDYTNESGEKEIKPGELVGMSVGSLNGVYRYLGDKATINLDDADYTNTDTWEKKTSETQLRKGDTVKVADDHQAGGVAGYTYAYIGKNNAKIDLNEADYTDDSQWELQVPELSVSVIDAGHSWSVLDAMGTAYTLTLDGDSLAATKNSINAVSVAASAAVGLSASGTGLALSGAGAVAINTVNGGTDAVVQGSVVESAGDVILKARSDASISATIAAISAAVGAGMGSGIGASIGISVARNLIGEEGFGATGDDAIATVHALVVDSDVTAVGTLNLSATATRTIDALVIAGSAAVGLGATTGIAVSGSGVWAENAIGTRIQAGIDTQGQPGERRSDISVGDVIIRAEDASAIKSLAGAASIAASFGGTTGVSVSIGVSLARNVIDTQVLAGIAGASLVAQNSISVQATSSGSIEVVAFAASAALAFGGTTGVGVSGAGASAMNVILGDTLAVVNDSELKAAAPVEVLSTARNSIDAFILSASIGVGMGGVAGVGASIGIALARNYVGFDPNAYAGAVTYTSGGVNPEHIVKGDVIRMGPRSGARANEVYKYIGDDTLVRQDANDDGEPDDLIMTQDYTDTEKWEQLTTPSANRILALVTGSSVLSLNEAGKNLDLSVIAKDSQSINSTIFAGSVAASVGGTVGVALSGAGGSAINRIGSETRALVSNTTGTGIDVDGNMTVKALDDAHIDSTVLAVSVAFSAGSFGGSLAVGVSLADNAISSTVSALIDRALVTAEGDITVAANDTSTITSSSTAVAIAISASIGISFAGGGANSYNAIDTSILAGIDRSTSTPVSGSVEGWSEVTSRKGNIQVTADSTAQASSRVLAAAASFGLIAAAAAGTVAENRLSPVLDAYIRATTVVAKDKSHGDVRVAANARQTAYANVASIAVSSGISVGVSSVTNTDSGKVHAWLGDDVGMNATSLHILAYANDDILQKTIAASGGLLAGIAGADSTLVIAANTLASIGDRAQLNLGSLEMRSNRQQDFDSSSMNLAIGLFAGSGAASAISLTGTADVAIGRDSRILAGNIVIDATNKADKSRYTSTMDTLRSASAGAIGVNVLLSSVNLGTADRKFGSRVDIGEGSQIYVASTPGKASNFTITTLADMYAVDKVRIDGVGGFQVSVGESELNANVISNINVNRASLRNYSGDLTLATRTNASVNSGANLLTAGAISGAGANSSSQLNSDNSVSLQNADILGQDVKIYSGESAVRSPNILHTMARVDATLFAIAGFTVPEVTSVITERNAVNVSGDSSLRAVRDVVLLAEPSLGADAEDGDKRARTDGTVINISLIPYGMDLSGKGVTHVTNAVNISPSSHVEAGVNYKAIMQLLPMTLNGVPQLPLNRLDTPLTTAEKTALGLDETQNYEYAALELDAVALSVNSGTTLVKAIAGEFDKGEAGQYYLYVSQKGDSLVLNEQDYTDASLWHKVSPLVLKKSDTSQFVAQGAVVQSPDGNWYQRIGADQTINAVSEKYVDGINWQSLNQKSSDEGTKLALRINDKFYVVKPRDVALPTMSYVNLSSQLSEDRKTVLNWMESQAGNAEAIARYQAELDKIDAQLKKMGLAYDAGGGKIVATGDYDQIYLHLPTLNASAGGIYIQTGDPSKAAVQSLFDSGRLVAHGSASINIVNNTPFAMEINDVGILSSGRVDVLDGEQVTMPAGTSYFNMRSLGDGSAVAKSTISIMQDAYPKEYYDAGGAAVPDVPQNLDVRGRLVNQDGALKLVNKEGSINVTGELRAASVDLTASGDFNLVTDNWYHTNADPRQYVDYLSSFGQDLFDRANVGANKDEIKLNAKRGIAANYTTDSAAVQNLENVIANPAKSIVFAMGAININARYINVDGLLQSGIDNIDLSFDADFNPGQSSNFTDASGNLLPGIQYGADGLQTVDGFFDADKKVIVLDSIKPEGGVINLTGTIVSTGNGRLRVASGYASVNITNKSSFDLALDDIVVDEDREGRITITDTDTLAKEVYTFKDGQITRDRKQGTLSTDGGLNSIRYDNVSSNNIVPVESITPSSFNSPATETADLAFDGKSDTKYLNMDGAGSGVTVKMVNPTVINALTLKTRANDDIWQWDPKTFSIYGSNTDGSWNGVSWTPIVSNNPTTLADDRGASATLHFDNTTPYTYYKVVFDTVKGSTPDGKQYLHVSDIGLVSDSGAIANFLNYQPERGRYYLFTEGQSKTETTYERYENKSFNLFGFDWDDLVKDDALKESTTRYTDGKPMLNSEVVAKLDNLDPNVLLYASYQLIQTSKDVTKKGPTESGGGWLREKTITTEVTTDIGLKDFYTYALRADQPIALEYLQGSDKPVVSIQNGSNKLLVRGEMSFAAPGGSDDDFEVSPVQLSADAMEISGEAVFSGPLPQIKTKGDVTLNIKNGVGRLLIDASGSVTVNELSTQRNILNVAGITALGDINISAIKSVAVSNISTTGAIEVSARNSLSLSLAQTKSGKVELSAGNAVLASNISAPLGSFTATGTTEMELKLINAGENVSISGGDLKLSDINTRGMMNLQATGKATLTNLDAVGNIVLSAKGDVQTIDTTTQGNLDIRTDGALFAEGVVAGGTLTLASGDDMTLGLLTAGSTVQINVQGDLSLHRLTTNADITVLGAKKISTVAGTYLDGQYVKLPVNLDKTIDPARITQKDGLLQGQRIQLQSTGDAIDAIIDSTVLSAQAAGRVAVIEVNGNLRLETPTAWKSEVAVESTADDVHLETRNGNIIDGIVENRLTNGSTNAAALSIAPDVMQRIFPHDVIPGETPSPTAEMSNVKGRNVELIAGGTGAGSVGQIAKRVALVSPKQAASFSASQRELLSKAQVRDIVDVTYRRYVYLGTTGIFDLSSDTAFLTSSLWSEVKPLNTTSLPILASTDGVVQVVNGQWVEDRRDVTSVSIQLIDDLNISATGTVTATAARDLVLTSNTDVAVATMEAGGVLRLESAGGIVDSGNASGPVLSSQGDMTLITTGKTGAIGGDLRGTDTDSPLYIAIGGERDQSVLNITAQGDIKVSESTGDLNLASVRSVDGDVLIEAQGGGILASAAANDLGKINVIGDAVTLVSGKADESNGVASSIGMTDTPILIDANTLSAKTYTPMRTVIAIQDANDLEIQSLSVQGAGKIQVSAGGNLSVAGQLTMAQDSASLIDLSAKTGHLNLNAGLYMGLGSIKLGAATDIVQKANTTIQNVGGSVDILARQGGFVQEQGANLTTAAAVRSAGGRIGLIAQKDITLSGMDAGNGVVNLVAVDGDITETGVDAAADLTASVLTLVAGGSIGVTGRNSNALEMAVNSLNVTTGGSVNVLGTTAMNLSGLTSPDSVVVQTGQGALTVSGDITLTGAGHLLLAALNDDLSLTADHSLSLTGGNATLLAGRNIDLAAGTQIKGKGAVDMEARSGHLNLAANSRVQSQGGAIRLAAGQDLVLSHVDASNGADAAGDLSLLAGGAIRNGLVSGDSSTNLTGARVRMDAGTGIGADGTPLSTQIERLAASTTQGSIVLNEADSLTVGPVADFRIDRVGANGLLNPLYDVERSGLATGTTGGVTLKTGGTLTVTADPALDQGIGIRAGSGGITLTTVGQAADMVLQANLESSTGNISLSAGHFITQTADTWIASHGGTVSLTAQGDIQLSRILAAPYISRLADRVDRSAAADAAGDVRLTAQGGSIIQAPDRAASTDPLITANRLNLVATAGVDALTLAAGELTARVGQGDLVIKDQDGLSGAAGLLIQDVLVSAGNLQVVTQASLKVQKAVVGDGGNIELSARQGDLSLLASDALGALGQGLGGLTLFAAGFISSGRLFSGSQRTEYRSGSALRLAGTATAQPSGTAIIVDGTPVNTQQLSFLSEGTLSISDSLPKGTATTLQARDGLFVSTAVQSQLSSAGVTVASPSVHTLDAAGFASGSAALSGLTLPATTVTGDLLINDAWLAARGVQAGSALSLSATGNITLSHTSLSLSGLSLTAGGDVLGDLSANNGIKTLSVAAGGQIDLINRSSDALSIAGLQSGSAIQPGHISVRSGGSVQVDGAVVANGGTVLLEAGGGNLNFKKNLSADFITLEGRDGILNSSQATISARRLEVHTTNGDAGSATSPLIIDMQGTGGISGFVHGSAYISETTGDLWLNRLDVTETAQITAAQGGLLGNAVGGYADLKAKALILNVGYIGLASTETAAADALMVRADTLDAHATGDVRLSSQAALTLNQITLDGKAGFWLEGRSDLTVNGNLTAAGGSVSLKASGRLVQSGLSVINTGGGNLDVTTLRGSITQNPGAQMGTVKGNVVMTSGTGITVTSIDAGSNGLVALTAQYGSITDGDDNSLDVTGFGLILNARDDIGRVYGAVSSTINALETKVSTLSATAAGSIDVINTGTLRTGTLTVGKVSASGIRTTEGGDLNLIVTQSTGTATLTIAPGAAIQVSGAAHLSVD